jgi:hypothetical protein
MPLSNRVRSTASHFYEGGTFMSRRLFGPLAAAIAVLGVTLAANAGVESVNGVKIMERVVNGFPDSTLTTTNNYPSEVQFDDQDMDVADMTAFANRHDALASTDGGATAANFLTSDAFSFSAYVTLSDTSDTPRKEAGLRIDSTTTGDALFIINSDAGEIVAFGGPFYSFGNNGGGNGYTPGQTIFMQMIYRPGAPGTMEYRIDRGSGIESSGRLPWTNIEGGPVNYQLGMYVQGASNTASDSMTATFENVRIIPEPATVSLLLGGLALAAFKRRAVD